MLDRSNTEAVPDPGLTLDVPWIAGIGFDLFPKLPDEHPEVLRLVDAGPTPDRLQQRAMGQHTADIARQHAQQVELLRRQANFLPGANDPAPVEVDDEIAG